MQTYNEIDITYLIKKKNKKNKSFIIFKNYIKKYWKRIYDNNLS